MSGQKDQTATLNLPPALEAGWHGYAADPQTPDELFDGASMVRGHWDTFLKSLEGMGASELARRWTEAQQVIRENGVTYNVYGDPRGMNRPWQLDPIPLLISTHEARTLERGLTQRGMLLEALRDDL